MDETGTLVRSVQCVDLFDFFGAECKDADAVKGEGGFVS
jgi:hypothetical protein